TRHAGSMAERAGLAEDALAEGVFGGWGRCRCCGLSCRRCRRRLALATGGERQGGECKHCKSRGIFVHVCFLSAVCSTSGFDRLHLLPNLTVKHEVPG